MTEQAPNKKGKTDFLDTHYEHYLNAENKGVQPGLEPIHKAIGETLTQHGYDTSQEAIDAAAQDSDERNGADMTADFIEVDRQSEA